MEVKHSIAFPILVKIKKSVLKPWCICMAQKETCMHACMHERQFRTNNCQSFLHSRCVGINVRSPDRRTCRPRHQTFFELRPACPCQEYLVGGTFSMQGVHFFRACLADSRCREPHSSEVHAIKRHNFHWMGIFDHDY
jgi:hypothetical protein